MLIFKAKPLLGSGFFLLLSACSTVPVELGQPYSRVASLPLYKLNQWSFDGKLALTGKDDSWSADIVWEHWADKEQIKLSGPLGQGAMVIRLTNDLVTIDRGGGDVKSSVQPEAFINQQLGMFVPVQSLRYWIIGLPMPTQAFDETKEGFKQAGWQVEYKQMQLVHNESMPRKITVMSDQVKLKLIVNQWIFNGTKAK